MLPTSRSPVLSDAAQVTAPPNPSRNWVDLDPPLRNSDRIVVVFSQNRYDGRITFGVHREFDRFDSERGESETAKTAFIPEQLAQSYLAIITLALEQLEKLTAQRRAGQLPFPEGGVPKQRRV